tara:strand:- start:11927 stop:12697 length:771 start_codon:yes stop_codon:yes gene_type:complete
MAINVDTVYKTVLLILNKEQRGYITPDEFNRTATQVQLDIFEQYFDDLNQQLRVPQSDYDYSDRQISIDEKISPFKTEGDCVYANGKFDLPTNPINGNPTILYNGEIPVGSAQVSFYKLGTPIYTPSSGFPSEIQRLSRNEFYNIQKSPLTSSTVDFPTYLYESGKLIVRPASIQSGVSTSLLRAPRNINWAFTLGTVGQYIYDNSSNSVNFELNSSEQVEVITRILFYSGVIIRDPQIIQVAAQEIQQNEINQKS